MNTRLQQFLTAENISQSQFADTIGVARASVSHILAGRNKPGFDFIESTSRHYPTLNLEWLIMGTGKMYRNQQSQPGTLLIEDIEDDFDLPDSKVRESEKPSSPTATPSPKVTPLVNKQQIVDNKRNIKKIVVFYDDNTFQEII